MKKNAKIATEAKTVYLVGESYHIWRKTAICRMKKAIAIMQDLQEMPSKEVSRAMCMEMEKAARMVNEILRDL